tara:strand:+ start:140 stop:859 length:720 start_codon:yes stop_codon:yes gene_type:complete
MRDATKLVVRLASACPKGSAERRALLKVAGEFEQGLRDHWDYLDRVPGWSSQKMKIVDALYDQYPSGANPNDHHLNPVQWMTGFQEPFLRGWESSLDNIEAALQGRYTHVRGRGFSVNFVPVWLEFFRQVKVRASRPVYRVMWLRKYPKTGDVILFKRLSSASKDRRTIEDFEPADTSLKGKKRVMMEILVPEVLDVDGTGALTQQHQEVLIPSGNYKVTSATRKLVKATYSGSGFSTL